jgi:hypothetical protein
MNPTPEQQRLQQVLHLCQRHRSALSDALGIIQGEFTLDRVTLTQPSRYQRQILDQFAYRYTRLQDDMGARLLPAVLLALGEDIAPMAVVDRLNRLEQLGWLPSADEWLALRKIRNEFAHEYPERPDEYMQKFTLAVNAAQRLIVLLKAIEAGIQQRFLLPD